jgi:pyruvate formate lyase activating enzyme
MGTAAAVGEARRPGTLRVGGLTPLTTIDYPGELAAVVYCQGCPFRCRYCHNAHLLDPRGPGTAQWGEVLDLLSRRRGLLDAAVFSGGEPTLQAALGPAMAEVRGLGLKVGLHTAGPYPARLRRVLPLLDWVGLDIKALPEDYPAVTGLPGSGAGPWESLALLLDSGVPLEVRTTPMPGLDSQGYLEALALRLARLGVEGHRIQTCRTERMLDPGLLGPGLLGPGPIGQSPQRCGLRLAGPFSAAPASGSP